ncbi:MAG: glycerol-3-phosphate responsive antiterminator [Catenisphaera adipataccumulans]|uniref:glycerol-3-phosphate responsive antiterminator n=1 Tax=Catenisphaera adipataccumulans TaxID=700500 RepID=UPI003D939D97
MLQYRQVRNVKNAFIERIEENPIIASVKNDEGLKLCLTTDVGVVFILYGDLCSLPTIVRQVRESGRLAIVHVDLIAGLSSDEAAIDYIKNVAHADGIITTKHNLIVYGKKVGLYTIHRYFVLDSLALKNIEKQTKTKVHPDLIEVLPGVIVPKLFRKITSISEVPVMAGGLITEKEDVINALKNGVIAVSTTNQSIWFM